jgi:kinesin family protein 13
MLQNALGGNSKTIMICAVSPAWLNFEETLSTLRYADNAKKIKNKAVINESVQDKMIRELKEENSKLKEMIKSFSKAVASGKPIDMKALGLDNMEQAVEEMEENEKLLEEIQKPWEEKLAAAKAANPMPET